MSLKPLSIVVNKHDRLLYGGDLISGFVVLNLTSTTNIRHIRLSFKGREQARLPRVVGKSVTIIEETNNILKLHQFIYPIKQLPLNYSTSSVHDEARISAIGSLSRASAAIATAVITENASADSVALSSSCSPAYVYINCKPTNMDQVELPAGRYVFAFSTFMLPPFLPSSYKLPNAGIEYWLEAVVHRVNKFTNLKAKLPLMIGGSLYSAEYLDMVRVRPVITTPKSASFLFGRGDMDVTVTLDKGIFFLGERVTANIHINNRSSKSINAVKVKLITLVGIFARQLRAIREYPTDNWHFNDRVEPTEARVLTYELKIPMHCSSSIVPLHLHQTTLGKQIQIIQKLRFVMEIPMASDLTVEVPIIVLYPNPHLVSALRTYIPSVESAPQDSDSYHANIGDFTNAAENASEQTDGGTAAGVASVHEDDERSVISDLDENEKALTAKTWNLAVFSDQRAALLVQPPSALEANSVQYGAGTQLQALAAVGEQPSVSGILMNEASLSSQRESAPFCNYFVADDATYHDADSDIEDVDDDSTAD